MPGCAAPKCTSHSNKGFAFHRFPSDRERRKRWLISRRRAYWSPKPSDRLCSKHFEKSQYEQQRQDGKKLLKPFAVQTLFDVPNPPKKVVENRLQKRKKSALEEILSSSDNIIDLCYDNFNNSFPHCCEILTLVLSRYSTARGISIKNTLSLKRKAAECFSSRSVNKKSRI